ncbi:MAG: DUF2207 domain-containing protein [Chloroflexi bacterium]|nr:DUF2207 domain-containing protein [Chloroflexota bacterium]
MSVVTAGAVLAAIGLLFAMDPGGAIVDSGFPNYQEMDWKRLIAWGFRTIGVAVAQIIIIAMWLWPKYRQPQASTGLGSPQPGSMPAAAVSALQGHMIWSPTLLASIIEMCQRGALRIEVVGTTVGFFYRLTRQGPMRHGWERTIADRLPARATTINGLREAIKQREETIGDQIGEYLQRRGLYLDNPVLVRRGNSGDGGDWWMGASALTGVGAGLWAALWLEPWWANALIGAFAALLYSFATVTTGIRTGMLKPTPAGELEIGQWFGWQASMAGTGRPLARHLRDTMLPYAVALDVAQPWLESAGSAPPWFGSGGESPLRAADLNAAYRAFMHAPEWSLSGRSEDAAKEAAHGYEVELEALEMESLDAGPVAQYGTAAESAETTGDPEELGEPAAGPAEAAAMEHRQLEGEGSAEEKKGGGCFRSCFGAALSLLGTGVVVLVVLLSLDVVSPREKPCPLNSIPIPTPAQIAVAGDLWRDGCVSVRGMVVFQDVDELVMEVNRGEYAQQVNVRVPTGAFGSFSPDSVVTLAGWLRVEEDGTYAVDFVPDHGSDRGWWRNLLENLEGLYQ